MPSALHTAGLPSQSHHGVGARLVRQLSGAVRSAMLSGITLAGALRRPAVSQASPDHAAAQVPEGPAHRPVRVPRWPCTARPVPSLLPRVLARLLARRHRRSVSRPVCLNQGDAPFTPEACPQLSPKACAVLNTPLEDCDPETLDLVLSAFAQHIREVMSPEAGMTDPKATLPNLWERLSTALDDSKPDTSLHATPEPAPASPADAPVVSPHPAPPVSVTEPTRASAKDAPRVSSLPLSGPPASTQPADDATITAATPDIAAPSAPVVHAGRPLSNSGRSFRGFRKPRARGRGWRALFPRGVRDGLPLPWRPRYAACTGPP